MTAQISDTFFYDDKNWNLIASTNEIRFNPREYGLKPISPNTACIDGFVCDYEIVNNLLNLKTLYISLEQPKYHPVVMGTEAEKLFNDMFGFDYCYNFNLPIKYTGKIMLGDDFMFEYYTHMGWQQAWSYKSVKELEFKDGILINVIDYSNKVRKIRKDIKKHPEKIEEFKSNTSSVVDNSFALDYESKAWWI